ncbi:MAG: hypothetical protein CMJ20_08985 [Phycisphaeraceae bacterium]|nr:hypothetical protein [Phycisphaeraceae bacterium]|tara:strand:+ start:781 stop:3489 length:2709 start_codon:yes stop_codon:yes gene_type:complete
MKHRPSNPTERQIWFYLLWAVSAGAWLLLVAALVSYDPADWPGQFVVPHNNPPSNWIGHVGAWCVDQLLAMVGPGVWFLVAGGLVVLVCIQRQRKLTQPILRAMGLVLMCISTSTIIGMTVAGQAASPLGAGGLIANFISHQLVMRFSFLGTLILMLVCFWVGAVLAVDHILTWLGSLVIQGATLIGVGMRRPKAFLEALQVKFGPILAGVGLGDGIQTRSGYSSVPIRSGGQTREAIGRKGSDDDVDPGAGGLGATESFDEELDDSLGEIDDEQEVEDEAYIEDEEADDESKAQSFTTEELRAKIKSLPINFAASSQAKAPPPREVDLSGYRFPDIALLEDPESSFTRQMEQLVRDQAVQLEAALHQYRIAGEVVGIDSGPAITMFEVRLAPGTKVAQLNAISSDIARALKAQNVRIVSNMAGKDTIGIEVPNLKKEKVRLKDLMTANDDSVRKMKLPMWLGKDASGNPLIADLTTMPHMLIAGTTGSGKSVCINSIVVSFLFMKRPDELKLVLVDPKMVEMTMFKQIPHLMCPVVTEVARAASILEWATNKMDERYEILAEAGVRDVASYNELGWEELKERFNPVSEEAEARIPKKLPYIVFIIDELADLMMMNKEVEGYIVRLAQKSRAIGMHLILATQRPQANVVTGLIKSNMPCRISFKVASGMDSRIVLDQKGAELLLGQGDMLYLSPGTSKISRVQGTLVEDSEIRQTVRFLKNVAEPSFEPQLVQIKSTNLDDDSERDPLFEDAVRIVLESRRGSVSLLQRQLTVGYSRASRLIEQMAAAGIIGEYKGSQAREVSMTLEEYEAICAQAQADASTDGWPGKPNAAGAVEQESTQATEEVEDEEEEEEEGGDDEGEVETRASAKEDDEYEYEYEEGEEEYEEEEYAEEDEDDESVT